MRYILTSHRVLIFVQGKYDMGDITEELNEEICWEELVTNKKYKSEDCPEFDCLEIYSLLDVVAGNREKV